MDSPSSDDLLNVLILVDEGASELALGLKEENESFYFLIQDKQRR